MARDIWIGAGVAHGRIMRLRRATPPGWTLCLLGVLVAACSSAPVAIPPQAVETYQFQQILGGVRVAVDPFFTVERTRGAFRGGDEFPEKGLLPVRVVIDNGGAGDIRVDPSGFRLVRANGDTEVPLSPYDAFSMIRLSVGWWGLGAGFVGGSVPAVRNEGRMKDIEARALKETTVSPGRSATGFVYFAIREGEVNLSGHRIAFPLQGPATREMTYEIPIAGRRDIPTPASRPETAPPAKPLAPSDPTAPQAPIRTEGAGGGVIIRSPSP